MHRDNLIRPLGTSILAHGMYSPVSSDNASDKLDRNDPVVSQSPRSSRDEQLNFGPVDIQYLDVGMIPEACKYILHTGRLPQWIRVLRNLRVLKAVELGIIVVDRWLIELQYLEVIDFEGNEISTWPIHLTKCQNLKVLSLDGNPCLERQLLKSCTFREAFFAGAVSTSQCKLPQLLLGPEWLPQSVNRELAVNVKGHLCGGIYTLAQPPNGPSSFMITPLRPCAAISKERKERLKQLELRLNTSPTAKSFASSPKRAASGTNLPYRVVASDFRKTKLIMGVMKDAQILSDPDKHRIAPVERNSACRIVVPLTDLTTEDVLSRISAFILEEALYVGRLAEALHLFLSLRGKNSHKSKLQSIFGLMPDLYILHCQTVFPLYRDFQKSLKAKQEDSFKRFAESFGRLINDGNFGIYIAYGSQQVISKYLLRYHLEKDSGEYISRFEVLLKKISMEKTHTLSHPDDYINLPIKRLTDYVNFYTLLCYKVPEFRSIANYFRQVRQSLLTNSESAQRELRAQHLKDIYGSKDLPSSSLNFHWDASLVVKQRVYLEQVDFSKETADIIVTSKGAVYPMSLVTEILDDNSRKLRLICWNDQIYLWDDSLHRYIGKVSRTKLIIEKLGSRLIKLYFPTLKEVSICYLNGIHNVSNSFEFEDPDDLHFITG